MIILFYLIVGFRASKIIEFKTEIMTDIYPPVIHQQTIEEIRVQYYLQTFQFNLIIRPLNIFEIFVFQKQNQLLNKVEADLQDLGVTLTNVNITLNGCYAYPQELEFNISNSIQLPNLSEGFFYSDIKLDLNSQNVYVVNTLHQLYVYNKETNLTKLMSFEKFILNSKQEIENVLLATIESQLYIFCYNHVISIPLNAYDETKFSHEQNAYSRSHVYKIVENQNLLYVAVGEDGIDIYKQSDKSLTPIMNLNYIQFQVNQINIIDIKLENGKGIIISLDVSIDFIYIYALDKLKGLYLFKCSGTCSLYYQIELQNCHSFDYYQNTIIVIAETVDRIEYVIEIFLDKQNKTHYFNRVYIEDVNFNQIYMQEQYAILIGSDSHLIIQHSVYNCNDQILNILKNIAAKTNFLFNNLLQMDLSKWTNQILYLMETQPDTTWLLQNLMKLHISNLLINQLLQSVNLISQVNMNLQYK